MLTVVTAALVETVPATLEVMVTVKVSVASALLSPAMPKAQFLLVLVSVALKLTMAVSAPSVAGAGLKSAASASSSLGSAVLPTVQVTVAPLPPTATAPMLTGIFTVVTASVSLWLTVGGTEN